MTPSFGLIIVGDEILSGKRADKHMPKVIELLAARGLALAYADYVGDDPDRITATLRRAFASGDVVFCCGGIGATPDDHTRQCAALALGQALVLHPEARALIRERMQDVAREQGTPYEPESADNLHRLNMGVFPAGAFVPQPSRPKHISAASSSAINLRITVCPPYFGVYHYTTHGMKRSTIVTQRQWIIQNP